MQMVSEVMTRNVQFVSPQETVRRAAQIMDELNVGALPVCDGERLVGMVTDRDITVRATSAGLVPDDAVVDQVMSTDVRWCFEDQPLEEVMQQMADTQIRRVPVVSHDEAHKLVGIVSLGDIATKSADGVQKQDVKQVVEKVSFPSEPDRSSKGTTAGATGSNNSADQDDADSDRNPGVIFSSGDPSNMVEVTPADLANKNAPGSTTLNRTPTAEELTADHEVKVVRRTSSGGDTTTGETGAPGGISTGISGASGGTAGTAGSPGSGIGAKP